MAALQSVAVKGLLVAIIISCIVSGAAAGTRTVARYTGRVLYHSTRGAVPGVLVELVEAEDDGKPTDEVLGSTHADAEGRFTVELAQGTDKPVTLVVSAVRESADSSGDRRSEGYRIQTHRTVLGYLPHPSPTKPNTIFIERRRPGRGGDESDD